MAQITVGIPAYKTRFLVEAISSVLTQTFTDFELLISDDSPDFSVSELVGRIQDPRIRLIRGPRRGLVPNSVRIWEEASAPLLKFVYDDDLIYPTALAELAQLLAKDERHVYAFSRRNVIDEYGRVIRQPEGFAGEEGWVWFDPGAIAQYAVRNIVNPAGEPTSMLIRRSAFPDASCLDSYAGLPIRHLIDVAFIMNAAKYGRAVASPSRLSAFRQHPAQVSADRAAPGYSAGLFEWEICLRGAVQSGLVPPLIALQGVPRLAALYKRLGRSLEEIDRLWQGLPELAQLLDAGQTEVLTQRFRADLDAAEKLIAARKHASSHSPPPATEDGAAEPQRARVTIEGLSRRGARGWAWLPDAPGRRLRVEALLGDRMIGHAVANQDRPDLRDIGEGQYGFEVVFQETLTEDELPTIRVILQEEEWSLAGHSLPPLQAERLQPGEGAAAVLREHARFTNPGPDFQEFDAAILAHRPTLEHGRDPLLIAFYLSQFHAIPENDAFWGKGFTEWRQLARAAPRFPGHYQPRIPRDLGFYNLQDVEVMRRQAALAQAAGVGAFGFYYYWFNQQRVLEKPIEQFLASDVDMPFMIIWANENWTRAWDGGDREVLLEQQYRAEDEDALLADLARHMQDARYVRLDGRPLFVIYNPGAIPNIQTSIGRWRRKWAERFGLAPLIFMAQAFHHEDPRLFELDGALEFPPHKLLMRSGRREVVEAFARDFSGHVMPYEGFIRASLSEPPQGFPLIKTAVPNWDNDARRPNRGMMVENSTPEKYQTWLQALIERAIERPVYGTPLVAINAWNEWAEGAYLEPDVYYGSSYLNATARALKAAVARKNAQRAAQAASAEPTAT